MNGKYFHTVDKLRGKKTIMKRNCVVLMLLDTLGDDLKCVMPTLPVHTFTEYLANVIGVTLEWCNTIVKWSYVWQVSHAS